MNNSPLEAPPKTNMGLSRGSHLWEGLPIATAIVVAGWAVLSFDRNDFAPGHNSGSGVLGRGEAPWSLALSHARQEFKPSVEELLSVRLITLTNALANTNGIAERISRFENIVKDGIPDTLDYSIIAKTFDTIVGPISKAFEGRDLHGAQSSVPQLISQIAPLYKQYPSAPAYAAKLFAEYTKLPVKRTIIPPAERGAFVATLEGSLSDSQQEFPELLGLVYARELVGSLMAHARDLAYGIRPQPGVCSVEDLGKFAFGTEKGEAFALTLVLSILDRPELSQVAKAFYLESIVDPIVGRNGTSFLDFGDLAGSKLAAAALNVERDPGRAALNLFFSPRIDSRYLGKVASVAEVEARINQLTFHLEDLRKRIDEVRRTFGTYIRERFLRESQLNIEDEGAPKL